MPIEIKELVIRAVVQEGGESRRRDDTADDRTAEIVETCVREVLRVIKQSGER